MAEPITLPPAWLWGDGASHGGVVTTPHGRLGHANTMTVPVLRNPESSGLRPTCRVTLTLQPLQLGTQGVGGLPLLLRLR